MSEGSEQTIVVAPPPDERVFSSWEALEDYLDTYTAQTVQVFSRPTNTSVEERNSKIDSTHSTAAKILLTGSTNDFAKGLGAEDVSRSCSQLGTINACAKVVDFAGNAFAVKITKWHRQHNHPLPEYRPHSCSYPRVSPANASSQASRNEHPVLPVQDIQWDQHRKFREALAVPTRILDVVSGLDMSQYRDALDHLQEMGHHLNGGDSRQLVSDPRLRCDAETRDTPSQAETSRQSTASSARPTVSIPSGQSGKQSGQSGLSVNHSGQSGNQSRSETHKTVATAALARANKTSSMSKKVISKLTTPTKANDVEDNSSDLILNILRQLMDTEPTCAPSGDILSRFKMIDAGIKITPPVARKISSLPAVKPLTSPGSTSQIRRSEYIKMCFSEVAALRSKYNCLEQDVALEIIVLGVYSSETLETMTKWHKAIKTIKLVKKAVAWISAIEFALPAPP
ncbi:hypothetical protein PC111_g3 [Phytophthora cactorum]|nr:hypothetical protein PC111_g3 [Phytophthora cactorum]